MTLGFHIGRHSGSSRALLNYLCPICDGAGGPSYECLCEGLGVVDEMTALMLCEDGWKEPVKLAPPPSEMPKRCVDCAFHRNSPEHEDFRAMEGILLSVADGQQFYCHQGMHVTEDGRYIPQQTSPKGEPVGHPVCAGWLAARAKLERR